MQDPINVKLARTLKRTSVFSLSTAFSDFVTCGSRVLVRICNDDQHVESWNRQLRWRNLSFREEKIPSCFQGGVFYNLPIALLACCSDVKQPTNNIPVASTFETRAKVCSLPHLKLIFQGYMVASMTAKSTARLHCISCKRAMKRAHADMRTRAARRDNLSCIKRQQTPSLSWSRNQAAAWILTDNSQRRTWLPRSLCTTMHSRTSWFHLKTVQLESTNLCQFSLKPTEGKRTVHS